MKTTTFRLSLIACLFALAALNSSAQFSFTNSNSLITTATHSGCCVTVVDVNSDGLDDILIMDQSRTLTLELQNRDGSFTRDSLGTVPGSGVKVWGMSTADVDHNGWKDVATGSGSCYLFKLFSSGGNVTATTTQLTGGYFVQNVTFGDFNNDGWADLFVCDDDNYGKVYINDAAGNLPPIGRSTTSLAIGTGSKSLTVQAGLAYTTGQAIRIGFNGANYMTGTVTSYNSGTGALVANISSVVGSGTFTGWAVDPTVILNININPGLVVGSDPYDSGNYGSVWTDFDNDGDLDLYIAHCRQSASSNTDVRRRDRLFVNNGDNTFTENAQAYGIEVTDFKQTWTTSFGDIDNDGDLDIVMTNHGENGQVLQNDGTGHFTDITVASGFTTPGMDPIESVVEDFDNDGFLDILVSGGGSGDSYFLYHSNGNGTFTLANTIPSAGHSMLSFALGDLNHDGKIDMYASYGNVYNTPTSTADVLYLNSTNNQNHFITFDLKGTVSNMGAIGARVTIYGPWGKQIREVRAGESYGTANSFQLHFGLGQNMSVDSARIDWPSHLQTHFTNLAADQFVTAVEGGCTLTGNVIPGPYILCTGQSLNLTAAPGFSSYLWSNGATTQTISVSTANSLNVLVTNGGGCSNVSATVNITLNPDETPLVTSDAIPTSCAGTATLTSSAAASYVWSGPNSFSATTQSINPIESGIYTVTIPGTCGNFTSAPTSVNLLAAPSPTASDVSGSGPASFTLTATGNGGTLSWYDQPTGGTVLGTGSTYMTPVINANATYYVSESTSYPGINAQTGQTYHTGTSAYNNTINGGVDFNVISNCTLVSVKVYTESTHYGTREIQVKNSVGTVIGAVTVNLTADTSVVALNIPLTPGTGYRITTNGTLDQTNFGAASPFLQRSSSGVTYPYSVNGVVSITNGYTGSATSTSAYYYFYDWSVTTPPTICESPRIPVNVTITTGINNFSADNNFHIYPNPTSASVTVSFNLPGSTTSKIDFIDALGRVVSSDVFENSAGNYNHVFDLNNFSKGIYTIHVSSKDKTSYQKLIIQ